MSKFTVIYDACVLYPAPLRDILIELATTGLFRARWTERIHSEWIESLLWDRPELQRDALERTRQLMNDSVMDCVVEDYENLIPAVTLPDENDRHVLAAAIYARADAIVTVNLKDFPASELTKYNIESIHPDDFICYQHDLNDARVVVSAQRCRSRLSNPPHSAESYLDRLRKQGLPKTVVLLEDYINVL